MKNYTIAVTSIACFIMALAFVPTAISYCRHVIAIQHLSQSVTNLRHKGMAGKEIATGDTERFYRPEYVSLSIALRRLSNADWNSIAAVRGLEKLQFDHCDFAGLVAAEPLRRNDTLKRLWCRDCTNTRNLVRALNECGEPESLGVSDCDFTDDLLTQLDGSQLAILDLSGTLVTDAGISACASFRQCVRLDLSRTAVTDKAMADVSQMASLRMLFLSHTQVTQKGIAILSSLRNLKHLEIYSTPVSAVELNELQRNLPGVTIKADIPP